MSAKFPERQAPLKNGETLQLREATEEDAENILAYLNRVGGESGNLLFGKDEFFMPLEQERAFLRGLREQEKSILLVGFQHQELVSVSSLSCFSGRERIAHRAELAVSVRKDRWGLGIGRTVMTGLISFGRSHGTEIIQLDVRSDNLAAVALYQSLGFEKIGEYKQFFKIGGNYFDAYMMNLYL